MNYIEVPVTEEMRREAQERNEAKQRIYGKLKTRRLDKPFQRMTGFIAEAAVNKIYDQLIYSDDNHYDFTGSLKGKSVTFDVKSNSCGVPPKSHYTAEIYDEGNFKCDVYIICSVLYNKEFKEHTKVFINGFTPQKRFLRDRNFVPKGTQRVGYKTEDDRWEISYSKLFEPQLLIAMLS
jgi:hypothetical protein